MPNGGPGPLANRFNRYYSYRYTWNDGYYEWHNCTRPSPYGSDDDMETVEHKSTYWQDYLLTEIRVSLRERRLLPRSMFTHKIITRISEYLGTIFNIFAEDVLESSTLPGSALPGSTFAV